MSFFDSALAFIEGIKSVIDVSGAAVQGSISDSVSDGIERAFRKIRQPIERTLVKTSFVFVSVLFIVWGAALFLDNFVPYHGLGFVIVGALFGGVAMAFLQEKEAW
ncbi:MAG: hypothetical protein NTX79_04290 [Candidatus Micrarchaeota archaeon]|nr:hypothetical protein [Candidatus Micrarchaeota archaeon]